MNYISGKNFSIFIFIFDNNQQTQTSFYDLRTQHLYQSIILPNRAARSESGQSARAVIDNQILQVARYEIFRITLAH